MKLHIDVCPKCRALKNMQPCNRCSSIGHMEYIELGGIMFTRVLHKERDKELLKGRKLRA